MKMGVREFRSRISEVLNGRDTVTVTSNGRPIAELVPIAARESEVEIDRWQEARDAFRARWRAETPDWCERLAGFGLDPEGYPFDDPSFR